MRSRLSAFLLVFLFSLLPDLTAQNGRIALVIGNGAYTKIQTLANPANDAGDMAVKLESLGFSVTKVVDARLVDMEAAGRKFAQDAKSASLRVFFYAGHGVQADATNWLIPTDADVKEDYELKLKAFSAQGILDGLKSAGPGVNIVILDACRDNPFKVSSRSAGASRGLAVMGISGSLIVYATAPGSTAADGAGLNGVFTEALLGRLDSPGLSLVEIMTNVSADVAERTKGAQEPWIQANLTKMVYLVTPEDAKARFATRLARGQGELDALNSQLSTLKSQFGAEQDAAKRASLDLEIKKQAALQAQKKQEGEALQAELDRQTKAQKDQSSMSAQLASFKADAATREDAIRQAAEARRKELEGFKTGQVGFLPFILAIEKARGARSDLARQYDSSLASIRSAVSGTYDQKLAALSAWIEDPWENTREFKGRVAAEQARLSSEKQASVSEVTAQNEAKKQVALAAFADAEASALAGLEAVRTTYKGSAVRVDVGIFDKDEKNFPVTISSTVPDLPFSVSLRYSVKSDTTEELKRRYLEFDAWKKAGALFGEMDASVVAVGNMGFVRSVDAIRLKAVESSGEKALYEDKSGYPIVYASGSTDWNEPQKVGSCLFIDAPEAQISINGSPSGKDRAFVLNPKPGNYLIRVVCNDGTIFEEKKNVSSASVEVRRFQTLGSIEVSVASPGEFWMDSRMVRSLSPATNAIMEDISPGTHYLEFRYSNRETEKINAVVSPGKRFSAIFSKEDIMVNVVGGSFQMGSPSFENGRNSNEGPQHSVALSSFSIGKHEVSFDEYDEFCTTTGRKKPGDSGWGRGTRPIINVNWFDAVEYCNWYSRQKGLKQAYGIIGTDVLCDFGANGYRLPTEAEWEYVAKGANQRGAQKVKYSGSDNLDTIAWYPGNSGDKTHPVGQKAPNALGIFDMSGNVWEWCWDWSNGYSIGDQSEPTGAVSGSTRVIRGGSWSSVTANLRTAFRGSDSPDDMGNDLGFRLARRP